MKYEDKGAQYLMEIKGSLTEEIMSVRIYCGTGVEKNGGREVLLAQGRNMLQMFGWGSCCFGIFGSESTPVGDIDALNWSHREDKTCGYTGIRKTS